MASTPNIEVTQGDVSSVSSSLTSVELSQADALAIYNFPAEFVWASQADVSFVSKSTTAVDISQADIAVVCIGRPEDPTIRVWTYTLDGHDYYVINLGSQDQTLVYDLATQQWSVFATGDDVSWYVSTGINWVGGNKFAPLYGSNIVVGSDSTGMLWFLDPNKPEDDPALDERPSIPFRRQVTGQLPARGYNSGSVNEVQLLGSLALESPALPSVDLEYSDDQGRTYVSAGAISVIPNDFDFRGNWQSLGSFYGPGRLFRVTDRGALTRIDSLTVLLTVPKDK